MKLSCFAASMAIILSASLASGNQRVAQVHSAVMSYVNDNMGSIRMMRGSSAHLVCYDDFIPLINDLANKAKQISSKCVDTADLKKRYESDFLKASRADLFNEVKRVQDSLTACIESSDSMRFFECLNGLDDDGIFYNIGMRASANINRNAKVMQEIEFNEQSCHRKAIDDVKDQTDEAFGSLRNCMELDRTYSTTTQATTSADYIWSME